jgi:hypothetical protein
MSLRDEHLERERAAWTAFSTSLDAGHDIHGWSAVTTAAHVAFWADRAARAFESMQAGTYDPAEFAQDIDDLNAEMLPRWEAVAPEDARVALDAARSRLVTAWSSFEEPTKAQAAWFAGDSHEHYEDHTEGTDGS